MAVGNAFSLGSVFVELGVKSEGFNRQLGDAEGKIQKRFGNIQKMAGGLALGLGAASAGITAGFIGIVKSGAEFGREMAGVSAITRGTGEEMDGLSKLALQLGKDTVFSASTAAGAMTELAKGGVSIQDIMNGAARATVDLASAGRVDLSQAAAISANALNAFGLEGKDLTRVVNQIAGVALATTADVNSFAMALASGGGAAVAAGQSFEDFALATGVMAKAAIVGSDAGTSLKTMYISLIPSGAGAKDAMAELGIVTEEGGNKFLDAEGNVRSFTEISGVLNEATKDLSESERIYLLKQAFGTDAFRAAMAAAKLGAEGVQELADSMNEVNAAAVAEENLNSLAGDMTMLQGSVGTLAAILNLHLEPALRFLVQQGTKVVNWLADMDPLVQKVALVFGVGSAIITGLAAAGLAIVAFSGPLLALVGTSAAPGIIAGVLAVLTGPVGLVVAIGALLGAFVLFSPEVRGAVTGFLSTVWETIEPLGSFLAEHIGAFIEFAAPWVKLGGGVLMQGATAAIVLAFKAMGVHVKNIGIVAGGVIDFFTFVATWIRDTWSSIGASDFFGKVWDDLGKTLDMFIGEDSLLFKVFNAFAGLIGGDGEGGLKDMFGKMGGWMETKLKAAHDLISGLPIFGELWTNTTDLIGDIATEAAAIGTTIKDAITGPTKESLKSDVETFAKELIDDAHLGKLREPLGKVVSMLSDPTDPDGIIAGAKSMADLFETGEGRDAIDRFNKQFEDPTKIGSMVHSMKEAAQGMLDALDDVLLGTGEGEGLQFLATTAVEDWDKAVKPIGKAIPDALSNAKGITADALASYHEPEGPFDVMGRSMFLSGTGAGEGYGKKMVEALEGQATLLGPAFAPAMTGLDASIALAILGPEAKLSGLTGVAATAAGQINRTLNEIHTGMHPDAVTDLDNPNSAWNLLKQGFQNTMDWLTGINEGDFYGNMLRVWQDDIPNILRDFVGKWSDPRDPETWLKIGQAWSGEDGVMAQIKDAIREGGFSAVETFIEYLIEPIIVAISGVARRLAALKFPDLGNRQPALTDINPLYDPTAPSSVLNKPWFSWQPGDGEPSAADPPPVVDGPGALNTDEAGEQKPPGPPKPKSGFGEPETPDPPGEQHGPPAPTGDDASVSGFQKWAKEKLSFLPDDLEEAAEAVAVATIVIAVGAGWYYTNYVRDPLWEMWHDLGRGMDMLPANVRNAMVEALKGAGHQARATAFTDIVRHSQDTWRYQLSVSLMSGRAARAELTRAMERPTTYGNQVITHGPTAVGASLLENGLFAPAMIGLDNTVWQLFMAGHLVLVSGQDGNDYFIEPADLGQTGVPVFNPIAAAPGLRNNNNAPPPAVTPPPPRVATYAEKLAAVTARATQVITAAAVVFNENRLDKSGLGVMGEGGETSEESALAAIDKLRADALALGISDSDFSNIVVSGPGQQHTQIWSAEQMLRAGGSGPRSIAINLNTDMYFATRENYQDLARIIADVLVQEGIQVTV